MDSNEKAEQLLTYAQLAEKIVLIEAENRELKTRADRVGLVFKDIPEEGDAALLADGYLPILTKDHSLSLYKPEENETGANTILIEGDNISALFALQHTHKGKIDVIYIDPPYNTGSDGFIYDDKQVYKSENKELQGLEKSLDGTNRLVGKNDPYRHSKWLSFMRRRLYLAKSLLSPDGIIFISIDDNEQSRLKLLMDDIFGEHRFIANIIWQSRKSVSNDTLISMNHNSTLVYAIDPAQLLLDAKAGKVFRKKIDKTKFQNPDNDSRGAWTADPFDAPNIRTNLSYPITNPNTGMTYLPPVGRCWRTTEEEYQRLLSDNRIVFGKNGNSKPQRKRFLSEAMDKGSVLTTIWTESGTTTDGSRELKEIFGDIPFTNPKPVSLIKQIIEIATSKKEAIILDFFAGSGTTAQAVAELNGSDGGQRKCILVTNNEAGISENITSERIKRILSGERWANRIKRPSLPGELHYYKLSLQKFSVDHYQMLDEIKENYIGMAALETDTHRTRFSNDDFTLLEGVNSLSFIWNDIFSMQGNPDEVTNALLDIDRTSIKTYKEKFVFLPSFDDKTLIEIPEGWTIKIYPREYLTEFTNTRVRLIGASILYPAAITDK